MTDRERGLGSPEPPIASVLIPALNEASDIAGCIDAVAGQRLRHGEFEVLLIDGGSVDATVRVATDAAARRGVRLRVLANPARTSATSLNLGAQEARGEVVVRVDARARIGKHHVQTCIDLLGEPPIGVVGGGQHPVARRGAGVVGRGIARSLSNRYTTGLARYRRGGVAGATDTVWMGAFRRADLLRLGGWPTFPEQNQDYRLNERYRADGQLVWFDGRLSASYLPRESYGELVRQYHRFGRAKGRIWRSGGALSMRHAVLLTAPLVLGAALVSGARRWGASGPAAALIGAAALLDELGSSTPASPAERAAAMVATVIADSAWFAGVIDGLVRR